MNGLVMLSAEGGKGKYDVIEAYQKIRTGDAAAMAAWNGRL